jgi:acylpyruvate hydrolase
MSTFTKTGRNIICIGRNYVAHVHELNNKVPKEPFYFLKPTSSYLDPGQGPIEVPQGINAHYEGMRICNCAKSDTRAESWTFRAVELGVVIGKGGRDILESQALDHVAGYSEYSSICWISYQRQSALLVTH